MADRVDDAPFALGGRRLELHRHGPAAGERPTIVFLHEGLGSAAQWRDFPERLADATGCGAIVYSRFGYGRSAPITLPRPLRYMHDEGETVLPALLDATGVQRAILFGHSDGASIALVHAGTPAARGRVIGLVLEAPHVLCEDVSVESIARARDAYLTGDLRERMARYHDDVDGAFWGWNRAWLDPAFRAWNLEGYLPTIAAPTLVVQGEDDPYGTLAQVEAVARGVPGGVERRILPRCGHAPHRERPEETLAVATDFIRRIVHAFAGAP